MELVSNGIGEIRLGMSPSQVENILGTHHTFEEWMGGNLNDALLYPGLVICFNRSDSNRPLADSQVSEIWIHPNQPTTLAGKEIFSLYKRDIESYFNANGIVFKYVRGDVCIPEYGWEFCFNEEDERIIAVYLLRFSEESK